MGALSPRARTFALLPLAALGLHQLRYQLAFGHESDHELAASGHAYLASLAPVLAFCAALVAAELIFRLARASRGRAAARPMARFLTLAAVVASALLTIYVAQELLEGMLSTGHADGLAGVFGGGGWWSVPIAIALGATVALFLRGADAAVAALASVRRRRARPRAAHPPLPKPIEVLLPVPAPFAAAAPSRAPPFTAVPR